VQAFSRALLALPALTLAFCSSGPEPSGTDAGGAGWDAAAALDSGVPADAAQPLDSGVAPDAAQLMDSGVAPDAGVPTLGEISPQDLHAALQVQPKGFLLINVHTPYAGVVPGTDKSIPYTDVDGLAAYIGNLDQGAVLTCLGGPMSTSAGDALVARGFRKISELKGGMNAWVAAGYSLQQ